MLDLARRRRTVGLPATLTVLGLAACGDEPTRPPDGAGTIVVRVTTTGRLLDPDGYVVRLGETDVGSTDAAGTLTRTGVAPGAVTVRLDDLADNCRVTEPASGAVAASVAAGESTTAAFTVACEADLRGRIVFTRDVGGASGGNTEIFVTDADGTNVTRLTTTVASDNDPTVSPDGRQIAFVSGRRAPGTIHVMDADGENVREIAPSADCARRPVWSPAGTVIAFQRCDPAGGPSDVYTVRPDGSDLALLLEDARDASWSPDGSALVYVDPVGRVHRVGTDGLNPTPLTPEDRAFATPAWSPDGGSILLQGLVGVASRGLYVMRADGTQLRALTDPRGPGGESGDDHYPSWSPDGSRVVFSRLVFAPGWGPMKLFGMRADGTGIVQLSGSDANDRTPHWAR